MSAKVHGRSKKALIEMFMRGLKNELVVEVKLKKLKTLIQALEVALIKDDQL